ncbi:hypothetical protein Ahy_A04g018061 [Arachis hypogaea]|uniref:Uncharacterized protein n=1 Tax=Arachis hypogaea TaxID=3818 RepID=A0A445DCQ7_ARAHY|nr:hypothetical protein Ahy_A04g018061 [Arachis hypogaea]
MIISGVWQFFKWKSSHGLCMLQEIMRIVADISRHFMMIIHVQEKIQIGLQTEHGWLQCEAELYFRSKCDLILHRNSLARALADAKNVVYGDEKAQYALLRDYAETLLKTNPGFTVKIGVILLPDREVMFEKMYVCLSGCKNGFRSGCRLLIGLDGAFLKTQIGGQILSAVAQDANHHIYVIAWAIVNVENKEI